MKIIKQSLFLAICFVLFISITFPARASLITIDRRGNIIWKVLSSEESIELEIPKRDYLEVKDVAAEIPDPEATISLAKVDGKVRLQVSTKSKDVNLDVTNYKDEIIEIEERPEIERVTIGVEDDKFTIEQKGVVAVTKFPINIDPQVAALTLETPSGFKYLSILPREAVDIVLRSSIINRIKAEDKLKLSEEEDGLSYKVEGDKEIDLFNIFKYSFSIEVKVSASTGEITSIEKPTWMKILGFLFV